MERSEYVHVLGALSRLCDMGCDILSELCDKMSQPVSQSCRSRRILGAYVSLGVR